MGPLSLAAPVPDLPLSSLRSQFRTIHPLPCVTRVDWQTNPFPSFWKTTAIDAIRG
jgi:hypothetical protein